jgi:hypothetical protein
VNSRVVSAGWVLVGVKVDVSSGLGAGVALGVGGSVEVALGDGGKSASSGSAGGAAWVTSAVALGLGEASWAPWQALESTTTAKNRRFALMRSIIFDLD